MRQTLYSSQVGTETLRAGRALTVSVDAGTGAIVQQLRNGAVISGSDITATTTFGPYLDDMVLRVSAKAGATVTIGDSLEQVSQRPTDARVAVVDGLVSGDGYPAGGGSSALPFVLPSSGTVASTGGSINSMTGLNYNPGPAYLYFPAGALYVASPAGWYYFVYGGATFGTVYANMYTNGIPQIPASPTPLITVAGAYTQATGVDIMGPTYVVPANTLGPNGYIRWSRLYECINNANTKACNVYFGGSLFQGAALASTSRRGSVGYIRNRGSAGRNIGANGADGDTGTPAAYTRMTVDTTQAQTFSIAMRLDTATDWMMIEGHSVELFRAA